MAPKDILALLTSPTQESVFNACEHLAKRWDSHVAALYLSRLPEPLAGEPYSSGLWAQLLTEIRAAAALDRGKIEHRLAAMEARTEFREAEIMSANAELVAAQHAMHADITVMERPDPAFGEWAFEGALFKSGRPVLLMPPKWKGKTIGKRVMVAWRAKREAARALADAECFLDGAEQVTVVTADATPDGYGEGPGQDISAHLAHRGLTVELRNVDGFGRPAEDVLHAEATALQADLIVMGGYGHSRMREFVFGGVTRALSRTSTIPLLMSH